GRLPAAVTLPLHPLPLPLRPLLFDPLAARRRRGGGPLEPDLLRHRRLPRRLHRSRRRLDDDRRPCRRVDRPGARQFRAPPVPHRLQDQAMTDAADVADIEAGRRLFAGECRFVAGSDRIEALPPPGPPEIAFAGRSNVGKSSLVNALTGRTTLARISRTPGRTQQLNFFDLGGRLVLVDMPGFGFARAAKRKIKDWNGLIERYLSGRPTLQPSCRLSH